MATIPELLDGHVTLEVECLDRLYLNGYIGRLATGAGLGVFMREQLGKPMPSPVVLGQISETFREAVKDLAQRAGQPHEICRWRAVKLLFRSEAYPYAAAIGCIFRSFQWVGRQP